MPLLDSATPALEMAPATVTLKTGAPLLAFHTFMRFAGDPMPVKTTPCASITGGLLNQPVPPLKNVVTMAPVAAERP